MKTNAGNSSTDFPQGLKYNLPHSAANFPNMIKTFPLGSDIKHAEPFAQIFACLNCSNLILLRNEKNVCRK